MAKLDWERARSRERVGPPQRRPQLPGRPRGISNDQAAELARLQRQLGTPYSGNGMTAREAARAIDAARAQVRALPRAPRKPRPPRARPPRAPR
jgi:hypothetical protein